MNVKGYLIIILRGLARAKERVILVTSGLHIEDPEFLIQTRARHLSSNDRHIEPLEFPVKNPLLGLSSNGHHIEDPEFLVQTRAQHLSSNDPHIEPLELPEQSPALPPVSSGRRIQPRDHEQPRNHYTSVCISTRSYPSVTAMGTEKTPAVKPRRIIAKTFIVFNVGLDVSSND